MTLRIAINVLTLIIFPIFYQDDPDLGGSQCDHCDRRGQQVCEVWPQHGTIVHREEEPFIHQYFPFQIHIIHKIHEIYRTNKT